MEQLASCEQESPFSLLDLEIGKRLVPQGPESSQFFCALLSAHTREGNLCYCVEKESFLPNALSQQMGEYARSLSISLCQEGSFDDPFPLTPIVREGTSYYLQRNWVLETQTIQHLKRVLSEPPSSCFDQERFEKSLSSQCLVEQKKAALEAFHQPVSVISGGPGTGKTFVAAQIIRAFCASFSRKGCPLRIKVAAPTGKAADRLATSIQSQQINEDVLEIVTLHRLLGLSPGKMRLFSIEMIPADLILIDEASMIDASLFAHLLAAIPAGCRLILLGDPDQLPPVGIGHFFPHLDQLRGTPLVQCVRAKNQFLFSLYDASRKGEVEPLIPHVEPWPLNWAEKALSLFPECDRGETEVATVFRSFEKKRLICPLRKGPFGINSINQQIAKHLEDQLSFSQKWAVPILVTQKDEKLGLYNGTSGILMGEYRGGDLIQKNETAFFQMSDGSYQSYPLSVLSGYELSFCLSVHKSQGSEFDEVICLLPQGSERFRREALYTAITRAKSRVSIWSERSVLKSMLEVRAHRSDQFLSRFLKLQEQIPE